MPSEQEFCQRLDVVSDKLSAQVRTLGLGLLAFCGSLLLTSITESAPAMRTSKPIFPGWVYPRLLLIGVIALSILMFDVLQYVCSYADLRRLLKKLEGRQRQMRAAGRPESEIDAIQEKFDYKHWLHRGSRAFFWLKIVAIVYGTVWFAMVAIVFFLERSSLRPVKASAVLRASLLLRYRETFGDD